MPSIKLVYLAMATVQAYLLLADSALAARSGPSQHFKRGPEGADRISETHNGTKAAAVTIMILYLCSCVAFWFQYFRNGRTGYMSCLTVGMTCMTIGLIIRSRGNGQQGAWDFLFIFLSPVAFLAQNYVLLSRLAGAIGPLAHSCLPFLSPRALGWVFVLSDLVTFSCQVTGTVFVILGGKWNKLGQILSVSGLALALVSYSIYTGILVVFIRRLRAHHPRIYDSHGTSRAVLARPFSTDLVHDVRLLLKIMALASVAILIRSVFRLIEQADGFFGYIATHSVFFYIFDAVPLWLGMSMYAVLWPSRVIEAAREASGVQVNGESDTEMAKTRPEWRR